MFPRFLFACFLVVLMAGLSGVARAEDCGFRGFDGTEIIKFDCEDTAIAKPSALRVTLPTDGSIRSLSLVAPTAATASKFRVRYTDTSVAPSVEKIMAIGKLPKESVPKRVEPAL